MFILWVILGTTETARVVKETGQFFYPGKEYYLRENDQSWIDLEYKRWKEGRAGARQVERLSRLNEGWDFPGGTVVKTPYFQCRRHSFDPWLGN